jgi:hypothetical protein
VGDGVLPPLRRAGVTRRGPVPALKQGLLGLETKPRRRWQPCEWPCCIVVLIAASCGAGGFALTYYRFASLFAGIVGAIVGVGSVFLFHILLVRWLNWGAYLSWDQPICRCGATNYQVVKRNLSSVTFKCRQCGCHYINEHFNRYFRTDRLSHT